MNIWSHLYRTSKTQIYNNPSKNTSYANKKRATSVYRTKITQTMTADNKEKREPKQTKNRRRFVAEYIFESTSDDIRERETHFCREIFRCRSKIYSRPNHGQSFPRFWHSQGYKNWQRLVCLQTNLCQLNSDKSFINCSLQRELLIQSFCSWGLSWR